MVACSGHPMQCISRIWSTPLVGGSWGTPNKMRNTFLNETHSKGLHSPADFKSDFIPFLFSFLYIFLIAMVAYSGHPIQCISRIPSIPIVSQL